MIYSRFNPPGCVPLLGASLALSATLFVTSPAWAVPTPVVTLQMAPTFPAGGVLTGSVYCAPSCDAALWPVFTDGDGFQVSGRFLDAGGASVFVFVPEPPVEPGTYSATVSGRFNDSSVPFSVVETPFELPTFTTSVDTETVSEGELIRCQQQSADGPVAWFTLQTRVRPSVTVYFAGLYADQFRYGMALPGETASPFLGTPLRGWFEVDTDELCFDLFGFSFQDDSVTEIGQECVNLEGLGVGVTDEMSGDFKRTLLGCVVPPAGYEDDWCQSFERAFTDRSCDGFALDACFAARRMCPAGDEPSAEHEQEEREAREPTATSDGGGAAGANAGAAESEDGPDETASGGSSGDSSAGPDAPSNAGSEDGRDEASSDESNAGSNAASDAPATASEDGRDAASGVGTDAPLSSVNDENGSEEGVSEKGSGCSLGPVRPRGASNWLVWGLPLLVLSRRRRDASRIR